MTSAAASVKRTKAHCNECSGETNHDVLHSIETSWRDDQYGIWGNDTYATLRCCGCDSVKLRHISIFSEDDGKSVSYHPPAIFRKKPKWLNDLSLGLDEEEEFVSKRLGEIYVALQHNLPSLAAMGVRALLERIMIAKSGDFGTFARNIAEFERQGYVASKQRERLETILEAGHATIHRAFEPSKADVITLVDVTEHIVQMLYLHEGQVAALKKRVPAKTKKAQVAP